MRIFFENGPMDGLYMDCEVLLPYVVHSVIVDDQIHDCRYRLYRCKNDIGHYVWEFTVLQRTLDEILNDDEAENGIYGGVDPISPHVSEMLKSMDEYIDKYK